MRFLTPATGSRKELKRVSLTRLLGDIIELQLSGRKQCHANQNVTGSPFFHFLQEVENMDGSKQGKCTYIMPCVPSPTAGGENFRSEDLFNHQ